MCGLLHDVGVPVLLQAACDRLPDVAQRRADVLAVVDDLHASVGGDLVRAWHLPDRIAAAVSEHHAGPAEQLACIVALADHLADLCGAGAIDAPALEAEVLAHDTAARLNLYDDDVTAIVQRHDAISGTCAATGGAS